MCAPPADSKIWRDTCRAKEPIRPSGTQRGNWPRRDHRRCCRYRRLERFCCSNGGHHFCAFFFFFLPFSIVIFFLPSSYVPCSCFSLALSLLSLFLSKRKASFSLSAPFLPHAAVSLRPPSLQSPSHCFAKSSIQCFICLLLGPFFVSSLPFSVSLSHCSCLPFRVHTIATSFATLFCCAWVIRELARAGDQRKSEGEGKAQNATGSRTIF